MNNILKELEKTPKDNKKSYYVITTAKSINNRIYVKEWLEGTAHPQDYTRDKQFAKEYDGLEAVMYAVKKLNDFTEETVWEEALVIRKSNKQKEEEL